MTRILIAEDSGVVSLLLKSIFESEPGMQVIGQARNGLEAVRMARELKPDLITMDIRMPVMDGFEATRLIMSSNPVPIVVISSNVDDEELRTTFRAIEEGALAVIEKPVGFGHPDFQAMRRDLVDTVRAMAEVKVFRHRAPTGPPPVAFAVAPAQRARAPEIVAIGCSTGGPQALNALLGGLPAGFPLPILVVQHMSKGFIGGLAAWLQGNARLSIKLAEDRQKLEPATVYIAPDDRHLLVERGPDGLIARLSDAPLVSGFRPSATPMFNSVARTCTDRGVGVLLTGMGSDGAEGLLAMRRAGARTLVQDEASSVVYGMPSSALALAAVDQVVRLDQMPAYLRKLLGR